MHWGDDGRLRIGAFTTIAAIAADPRVAAAYPGLAASAQGLATPQIRHLATLGGNLAQRSRCWYYRNPHIACLKKGGSDCPARSGNHLYHVAFDLGPCVAPHPSTMAAALLAYEAKTTTDQRSGLTIGEILGDGSNGTVDNALQPGEMIGSIELPSPLEGERALYKRAISRTHAEWPLVEVCARVVIRDGDVPVRPPHRRRHRAGAAAARGGGSRAAGQARQCGNDCRCRKTSDIRCKAVADDGIQARSAERRRAGSAGAAGGIDLRGVLQWWNVFQREAAMHLNIKNGEAPQAGN